MNKLKAISKLKIRPMEQTDVDAVLNVDAHSFPKPWPRDIFERELDENDFAHYMVVTDGEVVIGYVGLWLILDEAQITNIAILPEYRGNGIGSLLFKKAIEVSLAKGMLTLSLEVRLSNIAAQRMYRKFGLVPGGIRKNYYTDNGEDAMVMWVEFK